MKTVTIGHFEFSKIICGTNAFYGRSHFGEERDKEYIDRFDDAGISSAIEICMKHGINTVETSANQRILDIVESLKKKHDTNLHIAGSTRIDETSEIKSHRKKLEFLVSNRSSMCIIHAQYVDNAIRDGSIAGLDRMIDSIHSAGLLAGISTHEISTVELCEKKGYDLDTYLFPLNITGFVYPGYAGKETARERADLVRGVSKTFILMKVLGAGRIPPEEGIQYAAENSKDSDLLSIGFGSLEEIDQTMSVCSRYFK